MEQFDNEDVNKKREHIQVICALAFLIILIVVWKYNK